MMIWSEVSVFLGEGNPITKYSNIENLAQKAREPGCTGSTIFFCCPSTIHVRVTVTFGWAFSLSIATSVPQLSASVCVRHLDKLTRLGSMDDLARGIQLAF